MITWIIICLSLAFVWWKVSQRKFKIFKQKGIPFVPAFPLFGSTWETIVKQMPYPEWMLEQTHKFRKNRFFGLSNYGTMTFVVQEPELVKQLCIKDFENFVNHPGTTISEHDELLINSLSILRDQRWKDMRSTLSPAFTGSKMRMMFGLVKECAEDFVSYIDENLDENGCIELNTKETYSKVTLDVISSTAFGLKVDSLRDPENEVYVKATNAFDIQTFYGQLKLMILQMSPSLGEKFGFSLTKPEFNVFFKKMIKDTFQQRRSMKSFRPDIVQLLIQAQDGNLNDDVEDNETPSNGKKKILTDLDLAAQCFIFFFAGSDTTAILLNFCSYALATNEDVQAKLYEEIQTIREKQGDDPITYENVHQMPYLNAFISEVLRMYPPAFVTDRLCNRATEIVDYNGSKMQIPEGAHVWFNIYGMHHSHKYFSNPEKFSPERFLPENKHKLALNAYMPFGVGPRNCIGSRFALMDAKTVLFSLLSRYKIEVCDKTLVPLRYKAGFGLVPKSDLIFTFRKR
ncbi:cytochrome P450 9e2-like [Culicoides brevitarsis]|uniref:cytochrome P450 9e2-like n=1 Tax=Culicoides brevitarsis TaxID=469753 RepID=UPI00307BCAB7